MTTISVNDGSWTFFNYGPLTTTFTPAPSCTGTAHIELGTISDGFAYGMYSVQCETTEWPECSPPATTPPPPAPTGDVTLDDDPWTSSVGNYYSPGLICPSGWETVGQAARDGDKPYTTSGAMSFGASTWVPSFPYMPTLLAKNLKPSETVALCCPSGYTADALGNCFTTVPTYTPTAGCVAYEDRSASLIKSTSVYTTHGTKTEKIITTVTTIRSSVTSSDTWDATDSFASFYTPIIYVEAVTLIHHASDVVATGKASTGSSTATATVTGTGTSSGSKATGTAASTSNAAARVTPRVSGWNGIGVVLGTSLAAAALGGCYCFAVVM